MRRSRLLVQPIGLDASYRNSAVVPFDAGSSRITMIQGIDEDESGFGANCSNSEYAESTAKFSCIANAQYFKIDFILEVYGQR